MTIAEIVEAIKSMTILEVADLVKAIEDEFGVSAAPVAVAGVAERLPPLRLRRKRPSLTLCWPRWALISLQLLRLCAK